MIAYLLPRRTSISLSGIATFAGLVGIEHVLRPDHDPISRYVSEYAVGRYHEVMTTAFFALACGSATLLIDLARTLPATARSPGGLACLGLWTGAIVVAGIFPTDLSGPNGLPEHPMRIPDHSTTIGVCLIPWRKRRMVTLSSAQAFDRVD